MSNKPGKPIGRCPACKSRLILEIVYGAEWARCVQCQARFPFVSGYREIKKEKKCRR